MALEISYKKPYLKSVFLVDFYLLTDCCTYYKIQEEKAAVRGERGGDASQPGDYTQYGL